MRFTTSFLEESLLLQQRLTYSGSNIEYIGYANPKAREDDTEWLIIKLQYDSSDNLISKTFADRSQAFDKCWSKRTEYSYV